MLAGLQQLLGGRACSSAHFPLHRDALKSALGLQQGRAPDDSWWAWLPFPAVPTPRRGAPLVCRMTMCRAGTRHRLKCCRLLARRLAADL